MPKDDERISGSRSEQACLIKFKSSSIINRHGRIQTTLDATTKFRRSKRPDAASILKILPSSHSATKITLQHLQDKIQFLISTSKIENRKIKQGLHSFFAFTNQSDLGSDIYDILKNSQFRR